MEADSVPQMQQAFISNTRPYLLLNIGAKQNPNLSNDTLYAINLFTDWEYAFFVFEL
jgi:hypothetical protein